MFILIRLTLHVLGIIMPIVMRTDYVNNCTWSMPGCVGCSRAELGHELCALYESWYTYDVVYQLSHSEHSLCPNLHDCSQHNQAYSKCSCLHSLFS